MNVEEAVDKAANAMGAAESSLKRSQSKLLTIPSALEAVLNGERPELPEGARPLGGLEVMELQAIARSLAGEAAAVELKVVSYHRLLTTRARELGIDLPSIMGGGDR